MPRYRLGLSSYTYVASARAVGVAVACAVWGTAYWAFFVCFNIKAVFVYICSFPNSNGLQY